MMSVSFVKQRETIEVETTATSGEHISKEQPRDSFYIGLAAEDRQKYGEDKGGSLIKGMYGTQDASHIWQLDYVNLICGELGGF